MKRATKTAKKKSASPVSLVPIRASKNLLPIVHSILDLLKPPPDLSVSQWADEYRKLSAESSAEPGQWNTARAEYQRAVMDAFLDPNVHTIVLMWSAQVGKTEILNNCIGYRIDMDPGPILVMQPSLEMAQAWSKDRLAPMLRDTPCLAKKVFDPAARKSENTILHKVFYGGHITVVGSNSPRSLASRPVRDLFADEVDRYPMSAGTEGDPIKLAEKRTTTFWNRKHVLTSTPTVDGASRIQKAYEQSDKRRCYVPCPDCGEYQLLLWSNIQWDKHPETGKHDPSTAQYTCNACGCLIPENKKPWMIARCEWRASAPFNGIAGFHLNELYSPWSKWANVVTNFLEAKRLGPQALKTWTNTSLAEVWQDAQEILDYDHLMIRRESYTADEAPQGVCVITAGIDVQKDRLECEVVGWGIGQESWGLGVHVIFGDPAQSAIWDSLDEILTARYKHASGVMLSIAATCIDSGGHYTQEVYKFCKARSRRRVFAIKGHSKAGAPIVSRPSYNNKARIGLVMVGTDTAKELIYARLQIDTPGPGFSHFAVGVHDKQYFEQLTSERVEVKYNRGFAQRVWMLPEGKRNEALDCRVYALAAVELLNPQFEVIAKGLVNEQEPPPDPEAPTPKPAPTAPDPVLAERRQALRPQRPGRRGRGFVDRY